MSFLYPNVLWFLLLVPVLIVLVVLAWRSAGQGWRRLVSEQHRELVRRRPLWRTALPATFALLALVPIWLYDGRKGWGGKLMQYGAYLYYPLHLLLLVILRRLL